jgi:hypothetical protein
MPSRKPITERCKVCEQPTTRYFFRDMAGKYHSSLVRHMKAKQVCIGGSLNLDDVMSDNQYTGMEPRICMLSKGHKGICATGYHPDLSPLKEDYAMKTAPVTPAAPRIKKGGNKMSHPDPTLTYDDPHKEMPLESYLEKSLELLNCDCGDCELAKDKIRYVILQLERAAAKGQ